MCHNPLICLLCPTHSSQALQESVNTIGERHPHFRMGRLHRPAIPLFHTPHDLYFILTDLTEPLFPTPYIR